MKGKRACLRKAGKEPEIDTNYDANRHFCLQRYVLSVAKKHSAELSNAGVGATACKGSDVGELTEELAHLSIVPEEMIMELRYGT